MDGFYLYFTEEELKEIIYFCEGINVDDIDLNEYSSEEVKEIIKDVLGI